LVIFPLKPLEQLNIGGLNIEDEDQMEFYLSKPEGNEVDLFLCLVGRFLTNINIHVPVMKQRMADLWRPIGGITIDEPIPTLFLFHFYHIVDMQRVLNGDPWNFEKHMLILGAIKNGKNPNLVLLHMVNFWVQIHKIPVGFKSQVVGENHEIFIRSFLEYDEKYNSNFLSLFISILVLVDVRKPLKN